MAGRDFALKTFSPAIVGNQWESVIDSLPPINYNYDFSEKLKNPNYPMPIGVTDDEFLTLLYDNILFQPEPANGDGRKHWMKTLEGGISREEIYKYFIGVAMKDNAKIQKIKLTDLFDKDDEGRRALFYVEGNSDDVYLSTALLKSFKNTHPTFNIYFSCGDEQKILLKGNPFVHKVLPLIPELGDPVFAKGIINGQKLVEYLYIPNLQTSKVPTRIGEAIELVNNDLGVVI
jgi:hypothetical protein